MMYVFEKIKSIFKRPKKDIDVIDTYEKFEGDKANPLRLFLASELGKFKVDYYLRCMGGPNYNFVTYRRARNITRAMHAHVYCKHCAFLNRDYMIDRNEDRTYLASSPRYPLSSLIYVYKREILFKRFEQRAESYPHIVRVTLAECGVTHKMWKRIKYYRPETQSMHDAVTKLRAHLDKVYLK